MASNNISIMELGEPTLPGTMAVLQDKQRTQTIMLASSSDHALQSDEKSPHHILETSRIIHEIDVRSLSDLSVYLPGAKITFTSLSLDIRLMIYELVLEGGFTVKITSLRGNFESKATKVSCTTDRRALLLANKQTSAEVASVFYKTNSFLMGNGFFGSRSQANLHGLRSFISRVPSEHISHITTVAVDFYTSPSRRSCSFYSRTVWEEELTSLVRALRKHFKGLLQLDIYIRDDRYSKDDLHVPILADSSNISLLCACLRALVKHETLRTISIHYEDKFSGLEAIFDRLKAANPVFAQLPGRNVDKIHKSEMERRCDDLD
jgi:hypothetical protein